MRCIYVGWSSYVIAIIECFVIIKKGEIVGYLVYFDEYKISLLNDKT